MPQVKPSAEIKSDCRLYFQVRTIRSLLIVYILCAWNISSTANPLPIYLSPAAEDTTMPMVFFLSGDGGWYRFCQPFSDEMAAQHMPVVGIDSKKYFWNQVLPAQAAKEFAPVIAEYLEKWHRHSLILAGFSFGADVLPFIFKYLPAVMQQQTRMIVLMSPSRTTDFQVHYIDRMGMGKDQYDHVVLDAIKNLPNTPVLCISGDEETTVFPTNFHQPNVTIVTAPGSHHFDNAGEVGALIRKALKTKHI